MESCLTEFPYGKCTGCSGADTDSGTGKLSECERLRAASEYHQQGEKADQSEVED